MRCVISCHPAPTSDYSTRSCSCVHLYCTQLDFFCTQLGKSMSAAACAAGSRAPCNGAPIQASSGPRVLKKVAVCFHFIIIIKNVCKHTNLQTKSVNQKKDQRRGLCKSKGVELRIRTFTVFSSCISARSAMSRAAGVMRAQGYPGMPPTYLPVSMGGRKSLARTIRKRSERVTVFFFFGRRQYIL